MSREPPRPYRGLAKIIAKVCDDLGQPYPWDLPPLHVDLPALPDDAGPVETMLADAAGHRQFMASVAPPPPPGGRRIGSVGPDGDRVPVAETEPERKKPRPLAEMVREAQAKALRDNPRGRQPDTGRSRGYGR